MQEPVSQRLVDCLLRLLDSAVRQRLMQDPLLLSLIDSALSDALKTWQEIRLRPEDFCRYLAARMPSTQPLERALRSWQVSDLYLAWACVSGDPHAVAVFHTQYLPIIQATLRRLRFGDAFNQEVQQLLVMQLLVTEGDRQAVLTNYRGIGKLSSWLRVVAERTAKKTMLKERGSQPNADQDLAEVLVDNKVNPELSQIKGKYRAAFKRAFGQAVRSLDPSEINLLRHRFVDGLGLEEIGAIYRVHHSTILRRIERVHRTLLQRTYALLADQLNIPVKDCSTVVRLIQSNLEVSLKTFFRDKARRDDQGR
jgi:RNA polymerase sigma-70 factor, ECF subfamily